MDAIPDVVDVVLIFLALLSLMIWTIAIAKFITFYHNTQYDQQFRHSFDRARHLNDLPLLLKAATGNLARVCAAGMEELSGLQHNHSNLGLQEQREMLLHAMNQQAHAEQTRMENGLGVSCQCRCYRAFYRSVWHRMGHYACPQKHLRRRFCRA